MILTVERERKKNNMTEQNKKGHYQLDDYFNESYDAKIFIFLYNMGFSSVVRVTDLQADIHVAS